MLRVKIMQYFQSSHYKMTYKGRFLFFSFQNCWFACVDDSFIQMIKMISEVFITTLDGHLLVQKKCILFLVLIYSDAWEYWMTAPSYYCQTSNISHIKSPNLDVSRLAVVFAQSIESSCLVENEDAVRWGSADRWCSKYIWFINNFITY